MKPLAKAWAIFPPPINPIFNIFVSMFNVTLFFFSSPSPRSWSLTVQRKTKFRKYELSYLLKMQHMQLSLSIIYDPYIHLYIYILTLFTLPIFFIYISDIFEIETWKKFSREISYFFYRVNNNNIVRGLEVLKEKKKIPSLSTPKAHNNRENNREKNQKSQIRAVSIKFKLVRSRMFEQIASHFPSPIPSSSTERWFQYYFFYIYIYIITHEIKYKVCAICFHASKNIPRRAERRVQQISEKQFSRSPFSFTRF